MMKLLRLHLARNAFGNPLLRGLFRNLTMPLLWEVCPRGVLLYVHLLLLYLIFILQLLKFSRQLFLPMLA
jgi:hypothetical protein